MSTAAARATRPGVNEKLSNRSDSEFAWAMMRLEFGYWSCRLAEPLPWNLRRTPGDIRELRKRGIPRRRACASSYTLKKIGVWRDWTDFRPHSLLQFGVFVVVFVGEGARKPTRVRYKLS
jgi:hypothetical protein